MILFVGRIILAFLEETWKGTGSGWRCDRVPKLAIIFYSEVCWCHILILVKWTWLMICRFHNFYRLGYQWEILQNVIEFTKKELKSETNQNIWYDRCFFEPEPQWFSLLKLNVCNAYEQNIETKCGKWWLVGWHSMLLCSNRANPAFVDVLKRIQPWVRRMRQISNLPIPIWMYFVEQIWSLKCFQTSVWGIIRIRHTWSFFCVYPPSFWRHTGALVRSQVQCKKWLPCSLTKSWATGVQTVQDRTTVPQEDADKTRSSLNCFF